MKKFKIFFLTWVFCVVPCAVLLGAETVSMKDTLTFAIDREPLSLDPVDPTVNVKGMIQSCVYDRLLTFDQNLIPTPCLAESWKQLDDLTWRFNLRRGVKFHDGSEFTSRDVLFSLRRLTAKGSAAAKYVRPFDLEHSTCPDDYTFLLKLRHPYAFVEARLCSSYLCILSEKAVLATGSDHARHPVGTGPYKFVSWTAGDRIELTRNDDYWGDRSILKNIIIRVITESASRTIELESGGVDMTLSLPNNDAKRIAENPDLVASVHPSSSLRYIGFNCDKDVFKDVRVRQALTYATDVPTLRSILYGEETSGEAFGPVPTNLKGSNRSALLYRYNPEKAKQLLREAGYENGITVEFMYLANSTNNMLAELLQQMWGELKITLKLKPTESGALTTALNKGQQEICSAGTTYSLGEAGEGLYLMFHSSSKGSSSDRTNLSDPEVDKLLDKIIVTADSAQRAALVMEAQTVIAKLAPMICLSNQYSIIGASKNLVGLRPAGIGEYDFTHCYFR